MFIRGSLATIKITSILSTKNSGGGILSNKAFIKNILYSFYK